MERSKGAVQQACRAAAGKRLDWPLLPIEDRDQGTSSVEDVAARVQHKSETEKENKEDTVPIDDRGTAKKRSSERIKFTEHSRQSSTDPTVVADEEPGSDQDHQTRGTATTGAVHSDAHVNIPTSEDSAVWGEATAMRTLRTFELAGRIGKKPVSILLDSGSTGNFVGAQTCTQMKLKVEEDGHAEELKMADGTTVMTQGKVQVQLQCGAHRGVVQAKVFPSLQKKMILGMPWFQKENPHTTGLKERSWCSRTESGFSCPCSEQRSSHQSMKSMKSVHSK